MQQMSMKLRIKQVYKDGEIHDTAISHPILMSLGPVQKKSDSTNFPLVLVVLEVPAINGNCKR